MATPFFHKPFVPIIVAVLVEAADGESGNLIEKFCAFGVFGLDAHGPIE